MAATNDASLEEVFCSLRSILDAERQAAVRPPVGDGDLQQVLGRLERLLVEVLAGQAELRHRLDTLEGGRRDVDRLTELVQRLVDRLPLAALGVAASPSNSMN